MKIVHAFCPGIKDIIIMFGSRQRPNLKRPTWIIVLVSLVSIFLIAALVYPPRRSVACSLFSSSGCAMIREQPYVPSRELTDDETAARVVFREILKTPPVQSKTPKIAFMFLTPGSLPFEKLWDKFFQVRLYSLLIISLLFVLLLALFMHIVPELVFSNSIDYTYLSVFGSTLVVMWSFSFASHVKIFKSRCMQALRRWNVTSPLV